MKVVSNTTPIISLSSIKKLDLLKELFRTVIIPEAVYKEIKFKKSYGFKEIDCEYIKVQPVAGGIYKDLLLNQLDEGESETIILAKEIQADYVIIDESIGYKVAGNSGLNAIRTLTVILKAKEQGIIKEVKPLMDEMIRTGRWYSMNVYNNFLRIAGEL